MPENTTDFQSRPKMRRPEPEPVDLDILHEDAALIVVNKRPGMVVHPTYRNWSGTVLNGLLWRFRDRHDVAPRILAQDRSGRNTWPSCVALLRPCADPSTCRSPGTSKIGAGSSSPRPDRPA